MKPKKATAPSDSQRDSQDLKFCIHSLGHYSLGEGKHGCYICDGYNQGFQAGFQEAVEKVRNQLKAVNLYERQHGLGFPSEPKLNDRFLDLIKPTQTQGSEGEGEK